MNYSYHALTSTLILRSYISYAYIHHSTYVCFGNFVLSTAVVLVEGILPTFFSLPGAHDVPVTTKDPQLLGTRFLGTPWKDRVTSEQQETFLDSTGVALSIPPGAVPEEEPVQMMVQPTVTGPLQLSAQYQLASSSYQVSPSSQFAPYHSMMPDRSMGDGPQSQYQLTSPSYQSQFTPHRSMMPDRSMGDGSQSQHNYEVLRGRTIEAFRTFQHHQYSARLYTNSPDGGGPCRVSNQCSDDRYFRTCYRCSGAR